MFKKLMADKKEIEALYKAATRKQKVQAQLTAFAIGLPLGALTSIEGIEGSKLMTAELATCKTEGQIARCTAKWIIAEFVVGFATAIPFIMANNKAMKEILK